LEFGFWIDAFGFWMLDFGLMILGFGFQTRLAVAVQLKGSNNE